MTQAPPAVTPGPVHAHTRAVEPLPGPSYFFFGANRRSGTTWLSSMLNSHPEVMCKNEGWLFNSHGCSLEQWLDEDVFLKWTQLPAAGGGWLKDIPPGDALVIVQRAMAEALMREAAARSPWKNPTRLKVIGDKTTTFFCTKIDQLHRLFPEARFLHMVRDGRDVVVSDMFLKFRYEDFDCFPGDGPASARAAYAYHAQGQGEPVDLFNDDTLAYFTTTWVESIRGGLRARQLYGQRCLEVRYEDLLDDPHRVGSIFAFLGVSTDDAIVEQCVERNTFEKQSKGRKPGQADPTHPARKGIAGDWRNYFTDANRALFKELAGDVLIELGYESGCDW